MMEWLTNNPVMRFFQGKKTHLIGHLIALQALVAMLGDPNFSVGDIGTWLMSDHMAQVLNGWGLSALRAGIAKYAPMLALLSSKK